MSLPPVPETDAPTEPLISVGTLTAFAVAVVAALVAFGIDLDDDKQAAILGVVGVVAPLIVMAVGRSKVFSPDTVRRMVARAQQAPPNGSGY